MKKLSIFRFLIITFIFISVASCVKSDEFFHVEKVEDADDDLIPPGGNNTDHRPGLAEVANQNVSVNVAITEVDVNDIKTGNDTDIDGQVITYSCLYDQAISDSIVSGKACSDLPGVASFDSLTGKLNWTPDSNAKLTPQFEIEIVGSDGVLKDNEIFLITVIDLDHPPVTADLPLVEMIINTEITIALPYSDIDNDLASTCTVSDFNNASITTACSCDLAGVCKVGITPAQGYFGPGSFNFLVKTKSLLSNISVVPLDIKNNLTVNHAPQLAPIPAQSIEENKAITPIDANDLNTGIDKDIDGDVINYSCRFDNNISATIVSGRSCNQLPGVASFDATTGVFNWVPDFSAANSPSYEIEIIGSDGFMFDSEIFIVNIKDVLFNNHAPVTNDFAITNMVINLEKVIVLPYLDADGDLASSCEVKNLVQSVVSKACGCDNVGVCTVGIKGLNNFTGVASFDFSVTASALVSNVSKASLTINQNATVNRAPDLSPIAAQSVYSNDSISNINAFDINSGNDTDIDGDIISYTCHFDNSASGTIVNGASCSNLPGMATFVESTGTLYWTTSYNAAANPIYEIQIIGSDGLLSDSSFFVISVNDLNRDIAPVTAPFRVVNFNVDTEKTVNLPYTDANNDLATSCEVTALTNVTVSNPCSCDALGVCTVKVIGTPSYHGSASFNFSVIANTKKSNVSMASTTIIKPIVYEDKIDIFYQKITQFSKVDILWVVDNSGSMQNEQVALANNFDIFINDFVTNDVDFTMGITTTDANRYQSGSKVGLFENLTSDAYKLDANKFINDFKNYIYVGTNGSGDEKGLKTSKDFFTLYPNFVRDDAVLIVIYVSDENDHSSNNAQYYYDNLLSLKKGDKDLLKTFNIVQTTDHQGYGGENYKSVKYMELANLSKGVITDIGNDFYLILKDMGNTIVNLLESFPLTEVPSNQASISVFVEGVEVTLNVDYTYDQNLNTLRFLGSSVPSAGQKIEVKYLVN